MNHDYQTLESRLLQFIAGKSGDDFNTLALDIHAFQRRNNPFYGNYCNYLNTPSLLKSWKEIPAISQNLFKEFHLRSFPENETTKTFRTSGTTGEQFGSHHFRSLELYNASILAGWDFFKFPVLPQILLVPSEADAPHSSLSHMISVLGSRPDRSQHACVASNGSLNIEYFLFTVEKFNRQSRPVFLLGPALAFLHLFEKIETAHLPPGSMAMETGGYKGTAHTLTKEALYALFDEKLGLPARRIINEYSMTELSSQFYTRGLGNPHQAPPWMKTMVIHPETGLEVHEGETGILKIFDLANLGSVLAIQTRDLAIKRGNDFQLLGRDPGALPRGCSRATDEILSNA